MSLEFTITAADAGQRLDRFLAERPDAPTRSQLKAAIERGEVTVNGQGTKAGYVLREGDAIALDLRPPTQPELVPEARPLDILFEDAELIVLVKPSGLVVHPAAGHWDGTLANALLAHVGDNLDDVGDTQRPGIVHRLDKDTSGVMVVAKTVAAHATLAAQFAAHSTDRAYLALCHGPGLAERGTFDTLHGRHPHDRKRFTGRVARGRRAVTHFQVLERFADGAVLVRCRLETGRTHQVRVHLAEHHAPILGDPVYGGRAASKCRLIERVALHAAELGFDHPRTGERLQFLAPPPDDFAAALEALRAGRGWR